MLWCGCVVAVQCFGAAVYCFAVAVPCFCYVAVKWENEREVIYNRLNCRSREGCIESFAVAVLWLCCALLR